MLYFPNTRAFDSVERAIAAGSVVDAEGAALIAVLSGGVFGVKKSTGAANEKFAGVSTCAVMNPS